MLNEWFYSHKTWQIGLLIDVVLLVVSLFGLRLFHRFVAWHPREDHNHMVGLS